MALRILQFSTLFTIVCCSLGFRLDPSLDGPNGFPVIGLTLNLTDPKDVVVQRGQSAALKCEAVSSNGDMKFHWIHNGKRLQESDSRWTVQSDGTLYIPKVLVGKKSNGVIGEYQCSVTNNDGSLLSNTARLKVASIESDFSIHPISKDVPEGETLVLKCSINSTPPVTIQWELNNSTLPQNNRYVPLPNGALIIQDSHMSDSGSYRCKVINDLLKKTKYSKTAVVSVTTAVTEPKPPSIIPLDISLNKTILVGENLTLYCAVIGWPKVTVQWLNGSNIVISNGTSLNIVNASKNDIGSYTCTAHNSVGHTQRQFRVDILQKPRIIRSPVSKSSPPSATVRLDCNAEGTPEPKISWLRNGETLNYSPRIKKQLRGLVFSHTFTSDSGFYQCIAINSVGRVWEAARILISHDRQPSPPQNVKCRSYDSTSICLNWTASENVQAYSIYSVFKNKNGDEQGGPGGVSDKSFYLIEGLDTNFNYTFYVLSFTVAASDRSETVTCATGNTDYRDLEITLVKPGAALVKWNELGKDRECDGKKHTYRIQWREKGQENPYVETTKKQSFLVEGLLPKMYEFRVTTVSDPDPLWYNFIVPLSNNHSRASITSEFNQTNIPPMAPNKFQGMIKSGSSVLLTWSSTDNLAKYFTVCYFPVSETKKDCNEEEQLTSQTTQFQVENLKPNTTYEFKVRAYNSIGLSSPYSQSIEIHTPEEVPSSVIDLNYELINETTVCLHWEEPQKTNGILKSYVISYTPDKNWPLENWLNVSVPPYQQKSMRCWSNVLDLLGSEPKTVSVLLSNLTSETQYLVLVRAVSQVGIGNPTYPVIVNTKVVVSTDESLYKQKLAIVLGTITALVCILLCILCILLRRRCLKRRTLQRPRLPTSNNLYPAVAHYATHADSVQVQIDCCPQESQHLVQETITASVPPITTTFIDTKGGEEFPNGHMNGSAKPYMNGGLSKKPMHIRENPQYYAHQCNGQMGNRKPFRYEEDSNSNVKPSKFYSLQRLFENSKKDGTSRFNHRAAMDNNDKTVQSSDDETSNEYDSLNVTRLTCLDDSFSLNVNNNKRMPSVSDPKG